MKFAIGIGLTLGVLGGYGLSRLDSAEANAPKVQYLSNGYLCEELQYSSSFNVLNCENVMTGQKQDIIRNATNIIEVK